MKASETRRDGFRSTLAQLAGPAQSGPQAAVQADEEAGLAPLARGTKVRVSVDLAPVEHEWLKNHVETMRRDLGIRELAGATVFRELLDAFRRDPELRARISHSIAKNGGTRRRGAERR